VPALWRRRKGRKGKKATATEDQPAD
jgi:hypothetical protein